MMKGYRFVVALVAGLCLSALAFAGTPVEDLIARYEVEQGAKQYKASGAAMAVGRTFLKKYPIAPLANDIDEMLILRMQKASAEVRKSFVADFKIVMKDYIYVGRQETKQGDVDVYCLLGKTPSSVVELIVYNPESYALNCLRGNMKQEDLMKIRKPAE
jgi:hypothetical protein